MLALPSSALLGLFLLTTPVQPTEQAPPPICEVRTRHVVLTADAPNEPTEVCIRPGLSLALLLYLRDNEYPMPGGAILMSPWVGQCLLSHLQRFALSRTDRMFMRTQISQ